MKKREYVYNVGIIGCGRIGNAIGDEFKDAPGIGLLPYSHMGAYTEVKRIRIRVALDIN